MLDKNNKISAFVLKALANYVHNVPELALDIPSGFGRHTEWLCSLGVPVVSLELDKNRAYASHRSGITSRLGVGRGVVADASCDLPFCGAIFDLIVIVDFVSLELLKKAHKYLKIDGFVIYESVRARGENWRELLPIGLTREIFSANFSLLYFETRPCGPTRCEAETVRVVASKVHSDAAFAMS